MQPYTVAEIRSALEDVERRVAAYFESLSTDVFFHRSGSVWSPDQHLRHLITSVNAVARGLALPKLMLRLRFGRPRAASRTYASVQQIYQQHLASGAVATGRYVPANEEPAGHDLVRLRSETLVRWSRANARLRTALTQWSERDLERIQLPHPVLGLLTVREMLFFTLYHNVHHIHSAKRQLSRVSGVPG